MSYTEEISQTTKALLDDFRSTFSQAKAHLFSELSKNIFAHATSLKNCGLRGDELSEEIHKRIASAADALGHWRGYILGFHDDAFVICRVYHELRKIAEGASDADGKWHVPECLMPEDWPENYSGPRMVFEENA